MTARFEWALDAFPWMTLGRRETRGELEEKCREQSERAPLFACRPTVSLVIALGTEDGTQALPVCVESIRRQSYPHWEIIVVGPEEARPAQGDDRVRFVFAPSGSSLAERKNLGADGASGEWIGFIEPDAVLSPALLFSLLVETEAGRKGAPDLVYANHAEMDDTGEAVAALVSKPGASRVDLLHFNYIGKPWLARLEGFRALGGFLSRAGDAHEHDFFLRLWELSHAFRHVPAYLYHRAAGRADGAPALASLETHLEKTGFAATVHVETRGEETLVKVTPRLAEPHGSVISALACFRDRAGMTVRCLDALAKQVGRVPVEVVLVDNQSRPEEFAKVAAWIAEEKLPARLVHHDAPFNFAAVQERAAAEAAGNLLLLLNNDVFLSGREMLDEMAAWARLDWVGTVGCLLRYEGGGIQHAGLRACAGTNGRLVRIGPEQEETRFTFQSREVYSNTFATCLLRRELFDRIGLRALDLPNGFGDVAFHFECARRGLKHVLFGHLEAVHLESASRGPRYELWEECLVEREYPDVLERMLREDLAVLPAAQVTETLPGLLRSAIAEAVRERAPWLDPVRPAAKTLVRLLSQWRGAET